ncbi:hypothetical protein ACI79C_03660 [Geodermatophilus sp. SYSU D00697]
MPLPSVEAATREGAIAAAREKYGSSVRIVGIRRVRTGGVMGFFTTERFVAEVEEVAAPSPVERRPASRAESAARIEAALRRAPVLPDPVDEVAGLLADNDSPGVDLYSRTSATAARPAAGRAARAGAAAGRPAATAAAARPVTAPSAGRPPAAAAAAPAPAPAAAPAPVVDDAPLAPSPFTAALAAMVAGDADVWDAVDQAVAAAASSSPAPAAAASSAAPAAAPAWEQPVVAAAPPVVDLPPAPPVAPLVAEVPPAPVAPPVPPVTTAVPAPAPAAPPVAAAVPPAPPVAPPVAAAVPPPVAPPMVDVPSTVPVPPAVPVAAGPAVPPVPVAPPVPLATELEPAPMPAWASEPDFSTGPITSREEAIAEVLRAALAHDTSDAALTQLLRGVLAGSASQADPFDAPADDLDAETAFAEAHTAEIPMWVDATAEADEWEITEEVLAPTASDPAPLPLDATTVLPPLSLLPPPAPGTDLAIPPLLSRPPVPPTIRRPGAPGQQVARTTGARGAAGLATVTRLPVDKRAAAWRGNPVVVTSVRERPAPSTPSGPIAGPAEDAVVRQLLALGVPDHLLGDDFALEVARRGTYAALTRALAAGLPTAPGLPSGPGEVLLLVGPGVETLAAARSLAASLRLDAERLQWASRGDLAALAPEGNRISSIDAALERKQEADRSGTLTIVAVDAPLRAAGATWLEQVIAVFAPAGVWAVVEATRKPEDVLPWLDGLPRVDALAVQDTDLTADPAAVLGRTRTPVALLDGSRATAHRWASLLCERLENSGT